MYGISDKNAWAAMKEKNKAALYLRLSKEDKDKLGRGDDSASIQNQRLLLADYALQHDYQIAGVYSDDDESGLFDTRPRRPAPL